jgi:large subunit ribosomal protein L20
MPRVKRGTVRRAKRKKLLGLAKGYYANKSKLYRAAKESVDTAPKYALSPPQKRDFRRLWIVRINAAARERPHLRAFHQRVEECRRDTRSQSLSASISSPAAFATLAQQAKKDAKAPARA